MGLETHHDNIPMYLGHRACESPGRLIGRAHQTVESMSTNPNPTRSGPLTLAALAVVIAALVLVPAPLLPPESAVDLVRTALKSERGTAYLIAALGLHTIFYGALGVLAALAIGPGTGREKWARLGLVPPVVVGLALVVRSAKLGHLPMLSNALVPMAACALGAAAALFLRQHGWRMTAFALALIAVILGIEHWPGVEPGRYHQIEAQLRRLIAEGSMLPAGDERFARLVQLAFSPSPQSVQATAIEDNGSALIVLGIVMGHEGIARYAGLRSDGELVQEAIALRQGATLRGREDWARHFCVSAALSVVESPLVSEFGGLLKEEVDSLAKGTGFSFGDLAADRAGIRFAELATASSESAFAVEARVQHGLVAADYLAPIEDLPEGLTLEQFRQDYERVGSARYRAMLTEIDSRLDGCAALCAH